MALIKCPECGKEVSDRSHVCIQCGFPISEYVRGHKSNNEGTEQKTTITVQEVHNVEEKNSENNKDSCPKCGNILDKSLRVCMKCGYRERDEKNQSFLLCPKCGGQNQMSDDVCIHCSYNFKTGTYEKPKLYTAIKENNTKPKYTDYSSSVVKNSKTKKKKGSCGIIIWVLIVFSMISSCVDNTIEKKAADNQNEYTTTVQATNTPTPLPDSTSEIVVTEEKYSFEDEISIFKTGEYKFITPKDLNKYHSNLVGLKFYTITTISEFKENCIQSTLDGGVMMSGFDTNIDYSLILSEDDRIAVLGEIGDYNDYGFMGKSLHFNNCYVFAVNADCDKYNYIKSDDYFTPYFIVTEEVAKSSNNISEKEFKELCTSLSYDDILRNPDSYKDKHCLVSGRVNQVIEGILNTYSIYIEDSNGDIWACMRMYKDGESRVLENDSITVYGICDGTTTSTTVLGKQVTMPYVDIEYIN